MPSLPGRARYPARIVNSERTGDRHLGVLVHVGINIMTYKCCKFYFFLVQSFSQGGSDYAKKKPKQDLFDGR